jgi:ferredoxin-NADP reductase
MSLLATDLEHDRELVVKSRTDVAPGIVALELGTLDGSELPLWQPGSHIDVVLDGATVRQYSLCGDPTDRSIYRIAVLREEAGRGGSVRAHEHLLPGTPVITRGPRNHFAFEIAPKYRFIAGGIGITAILPMVRAAEAAGAEWKLAYAGRAPEGMAFAQELADDYPGKVELFTRATGRMDIAAQLANPDPVTDIYCCGPEPLMTAVEQASAGWLPGALHLERFVPRELGAPLRAEAFEVDLLLTGKTVTVEPGVTILEAVEKAGALVLSSCQEGTCGTCETPVLEGTVDHRDSVLTADEQAANDTMMICVSRAACARLVLEL